MQPSWVESLGLLLATQSFLLAATAIVGTNSGIASAFYVPGRLAASLIIAIAASVGAGSVTAWASLYDFEFEFSSAGFVGLSILIASIGQALLTTLLALKAW